MQLYSGPMEVQMLHSAKGKIWLWGLLWQWRSLRGGTLNIANQTLMSPTLHQARKLCSWQWSLLSIAFNSIFLPTYIASMQFKPSSAARTAKEQYLLECESSLFSSCVPVSDAPKITFWQHHIHLKLLNTTNVPLVEHVRRKIIFSYSNNSDDAINIGFCKICKTLDNSSFIIIHTSSPCHR